MDRCKRGRRILVWLAVTAAVLSLLLTVGALWIARDVSALHETQVRAAVTAGDGIERVAAVSLRTEGYRTEADGRTSEVFDRMGATTRRLAETAESVDAFDGDILAQASRRRVIIDEYDVDIPYARVSVWDAQRYVDSGYAADYDWYGLDMVGAHYNMGFDGIKRCIPGETEIFMDGKAYVCAARFTGHNMGGSDPVEFYDDNWTPIQWDGPILYTCNGSNPHNVTFVYLEEEKEQ